MRVLVLPGFSARNREERDNIIAFLNSQGIETIARDWPTWTDEQHQFSEEEEVAACLQLVQAAGGIDGIVAKSIGTKVAVMLLAQHPEITISKLILLGIPLGIALESQAVYQQVVASVSQQGEVHVVQNEFDNLGAAADIPEFFGSAKITLHPQAGVSDHRYNYPELVFELLNQNYD